MRKQFTLEDAKSLPIPAKQFIAELMSSKPPTSEGTPQEFLSVCEELRESEIDNHILEMANDSYKELLSREKAETARLREAIALVVNDSKRLLKRGSSTEYIIKLTDNEAWKALTVEAARHEWEAFGEQGNTSTDR